MRYRYAFLMDELRAGVESLAIIKYYELRNDRVLVLVPKRLGDNWTLYNLTCDRDIQGIPRLRIFAGSPASAEKSNSPWLFRDSPRARHARE
jgi:hypothetical protein